MEKSIYGQRLKKLCAALIKGRKEAALTQQAVANRLDRPQSFVSKYENGERRLDIIEFLLVTEALEIEPSDLISQLVQDKMPL